MEEALKQRRIVCAANRYNKAITVLGRRHWDGHMTLHYTDLINLYGSRIVDKWPEEQGFIDNDGVFLSRTEAWNVASAAGQILYRVDADALNGGTLFSENLY